MYRAERISRRLKLRQLNVLLAVAQCGSMVKAAELLAISQPVVSEAIADLETVLGVRLLDRNPHGVEPTLYGRALLKRSIAIFNDLRTSVSELESLADPTAGELRIGSPEPTMAGLLFAIIDRMSRQYPRIAFHVPSNEPPDVLVRELRARNIEVMIGRLPGAGPAPDTQTEVLLHERALVVAGSHNPWTRRRKIALAELMDEPWCLPPPESLPGSIIARLFQALGMDVPRSNMTVLSIHLQTALLSTGRFLTILPGSMLHFSAKRLSLKILPVELPVQTWPVGIVTMKDRTLSPAAQLFVKCARDVAKPLAKGLKSDVKEHQNA